MTPAQLDARLRLFAFTAAAERARYLAILRAFDEARERSALQVGPGELAAALGADFSAESVQPALDQLHEWGLVDRTQDDSRVRTIAEYKRRRAVYAMNELGWLAWRAVEDVLKATPGEAELQRLTLPAVLEDLEALVAAMRVEDGERSAFLLNRLHDSLDALARHAARFTLATSELANEAEVRPEAFLAHKTRLLTHLETFVKALVSERAALAAATQAVSDLGVERLVRLAAPHGGAQLLAAEAARQAQARWEGVVAWFVGAPGQSARASRLEEQMTRAISRLAALLRRVLEVSGGGVNRASQLEALAGWVLAAPDDRSAHALMRAVLSPVGARHFGVPEREADAHPPNLSWWAAPPAPVDTTLRKAGKPTAPLPPAPIPDRHREIEVLRLRQAEARRRDEAASARVTEALELGRPLEDDELSVLLRLLTRALHSRQPSAGHAESTHGRFKLRLSPSPTDMRVSTRRGALVLPGLRLQLTAAGPAGGAR